MARMGETGRVIREKREAELRVIEGWCRVTAPMDLASMVLDFGAARVSRAAL